MKIAIIQMSDLHITSDKDFIVQESTTLARAIASKINSCDKVVVVVTGDIIDKGNVSNYEHAKTMFKNFEEEIKKEAQLESWDYVIVPGNHDLDFSKKYDFRDIVLEKCLSTNKIDNEAHANELLKPQSKFWEFYSELSNDRIDPKISFKKIIAFNDNSHLEFHCYNTALLSIVNEKPQSLIVPEASFIDYKDDHPGQQDIVISVFHHKQSWLSTSGKLNNQRAFIDHIEKSSQIIMCGHEHQRDSKMLMDVVNKDRVLYLESDSLQQGNVQSFSLLILSDSEKGNVSKCDIILDSKEKEWKFSDEIVLKIPYHNHKISFSESYSKDLDSISAPIHHPRKNDLILDDIYVYPDLDPQSNKSDDKIMLYLDSKDILDSILDKHVIVLEGDVQCGKTTLIKMLSKQSYRKKAMYPLTLSGSDFKDLQHVKPILKNAFNKQYNTKQFGYDKYMQLERNERIVFIDNMDKSLLNDDGKKELWAQLLTLFKGIIVTTGQSFDIKNWLKQEDKKYTISSYYIQPLGHLKRNELIEKWVRLGHDIYTIDENGLIETVKIIYNHIEDVLGKELLPSNPIFLLTLLQNMDSSVEAFNNAPTSYAALYQTLIHSALLRSGVSQDKLAGITAFLSSLSFQLYNKNQVGLKFSDTNDDHVGYSEFYDFYKTKHVFSYSKDKLRDILLDSQIWIKRDENYYIFSYKYLYYYLTANELADMISRGQGEEVRKHIVKMCDSLHKTNSANILIFLAYLDKSKTLLNEIRFASLLPFENLKPITLRRDDGLYNELENFVTQLKDDVLKSNINPHEHRTKALQKQDNEARAIRHVVNEEASKLPEAIEENGNLRDFVNSLIVTRIIGQIIKNQRDTLEINDLTALMEDAYITTFRSVSFITKMIEHDYQELVSEFSTHSDKYKNIDVESLKNKISKLFQSILFKMSLISFGNLSLSVGTSGRYMLELYDKVAKKIDSPAADLITFTIKTYYGRMNEADLIDIVQKYKNNPVLMRLINARVRSYVYQHKLSIVTMQKIGAITNMQLINSPERQIAQRRS